MLVRMSRVLSVGMVAVLGLIAALFVGGESLDDPGGWKGLGLLVAWAVPMGALVLLAIRRPRLAARVLPWVLAAAGVVVLVDVLTSLFDRSGPAATVVVLVVAVPCGLLGIHRAGEAGSLVLGAAGLQLVAVVAQFTRHRGGEGPSFAHELTSSDGVTVVPLLVCAALLLLTALLERRAAHHRHLHAVR